MAIIRAHVFRSRAVICFWACLGCAGTSQQPVLEAAATELQALHAAVELPGVALPLDQQVPGAIRVTIARHGVYVDVLALLSSASDDVVDRFVDIVETARFPFGLVRRAIALEDFVPDRAVASDASLHEQLLLLLGEARLMADMPEGELPLLLHVDRRAPFELVAEVVDVARNQMHRFNSYPPFGSIWLMASRAGVDVGVPGSPPLDPVSALDEPPVCAAPDVFLTPLGVALFAAPRTLAGAPVVQPRFSHVPDPPPPYPDWADLLVLEDPISCPLITADQEDTLAALRRLAASLRQLAPGCDGAVVGATEGRSWGEVMGVVAELLRAGSRTFELGTVSRYPENGCGAPLVLS